MQTLLVPNALTLRSFPHVARFLCTPLSAQRYVKMRDAVTKAVDAGLSPDEVVKFVKKVLDDMRGTLGKLK
jgi:hypothetical protein